MPDVSLTFQSAEEVRAFGGALSTAAGVLGELVAGRTTPAEAAKAIAERLRAYTTDLDPVPDPKDDPAYVGSLIDWMARRAVDGRLRAGILLAKAQHAQAAADQALIDAHAAVQAATDATVLVDGAVRSLDDVFSTLISSLINAGVV